MFKRFVDWNESFLNPQREIEGEIQRLKALGDEDLNELRFEVSTNEVLSLMKGHPVSCAWMFGSELIRRVAAERVLRELRRLEGFERGSFHWATLSDIQPTWFGVANIEVNSNNAAWSERWDFGLITNQAFWSDLALDNRRPQVVKVEVCYAGYFYQSEISTRSFSFALPWTRDISDLFRFSSCPVNPDLYREGIVGGTFKLIMPQPATIAAAHKKAVAIRELVKTHAHGKCLPRRALIQVASDFEHTMLGKPEHYPVTIPGDDGSVVVYRRRKTLAS
ncbi:hypothetical protein A2810_02575 [candidate division Kazan bacterium RIFCSPHIGHO2_01_FULL_49_10]|uniref:Uncharacterized protein n=1 Tax=candidate division Kazan bacterium RIFCSPLOWO2_01_FULL_48_13 TaxID=1798539 RepID=A0A1F4PNZ8_UNCK3|nr:MAG: hypothetical protein A2810_02575 [candidate division Kazan bacterium RIFCSPHIGHO2_01_FULL_49_10]OGB85316.1 MAG: hypothetical protein A2994_01640 [candidate division Kazan bacterium RIFCSPLOWO2_01_FULL_48_13]